MAIYDTEEEQLEALQKWWKANSQAVIIGGIVGLSIMLGVNFWNQHQHDKHLAASDVYSKLVEADTKNQKDQVETLSRELSVQHSTTPYADYAALFEAKAKVQQGDLAAAKTILQKLISEADDNIQHVARLRLVSLMLASGEYDQGLKLIAETDPASMKGFTANYEELKGDLYVALERIDEARTAYENAQREGSQSQLLSFKLDDLTAAGPATTSSVKVPTVAPPVPATPPASKK